MLFEFLIYSKVEHRISELTRLLICS